MKKTCKSLAAFVLVACLMAALAIPAFAAALDVSKLEQDDNGYYRFKGLEYREDFAAGKYIVINAVSPAGEVPNVIFESDTNWWDGQVATPIEGTDNWYVEIGKYNPEHLTNEENTYFAVILTDWTADFQINSVEVTDTLPKAATTEEPKTDTTSPKTGDNSIVFIAFGALLLTGVAAIAVTKKAKAK